MLFGAVLSANYETSTELQSQLSPAYWRTTSGQRVYWPFERARITTPSETRFNIPVPKPQRYVQTANPDSQDYIIRTRQYKQTNEYPIVLTERQDKSSYAEALQQPGYDSSPYPQYGYTQYKYRPTEIEYRKPLSQRPVITIGPQPKLAYGEPFIRVPYEDVNIRPPIYRDPARTLASRYKGNPPREFGPFGNRGPYRPTSNERYTPTPIREYGPFGDYGPYAPTYTGYIPTLKFKQQSRPETGEYDVE